MTSDEELLAELNSRLDNPAVPWMPTVEDPPEDAITTPRIAGIVQQIEYRNSDYGLYPFVVLKTGKGRVSVSGFGAVLKSKLANVAVGDGLAIAHLGKRESKTKGYQPYDDFSVEVISQGGTPPAVRAAPPDELPDYEVEPGVFLSELDTDTLRALSESAPSAVLKARALAWLEKAE